MIRFTFAFVDQWMASYEKPPSSVMLDIDDTCDVAHAHLPGTKPLSKKVDEIAGAVRTKRAIGDKEVVLRQILTRRRTKPSARTMVRRMSLPVSRAKSCVRTAAAIKAFEEQAAHALMRAQEVADA